MVCFVALDTHLAERWTIVPSSNMSATAISAFEIIILPVLVGSLLEGLFLELAMKVTSPDEGVSFALIALNFDFVASAALQTSMHLSYVRSEIWGSFLRTLLSVIPQTILTRIISSFNTPKLHELAKSLRTVAYASMDSSEFLSSIVKLVSFINDICLSAAILVPEFKNLGDILLFVRF